MHLLPDTIPAPMIFARTSQLAACSLLLGIPAAGVRTAFQVRAFEQQRDVLPIFFADHLLPATLISVAAIGAWILVFAIARRRLSTRAGARVATLVALGPFALLLLKRINEDLLPGILELESLIGNSLLFAACAGLFFALSAGLRRWQEGAWLHGKPALWPLAFSLLAPLGAYAAGPGKPRDPAPDVLVILLDVLRADHLGCYGYERPTSPNIDALAADGILFENVIAASTYTKTSVASIFTGLAGFHHGVYTGVHGGGDGTVESDLLSAEVTTVAEALYAHGLNTSAWVQNGHVRPYLGYAQGFTFYADQPGNAEVIAGEYGAWIKTWGDVARSFTYLHIIDIHGPYAPPPPFLGQFGPVHESGLGAILSADFDAWSAFKQEVISKERVLSVQDIEELKARYDELVLHVDHWVGRIIDDLKASGRYDNTLIMVLSDHGEGFWEHGFISHSTAPYEELNHVPLIVKMPGSTGAGRRVERMLGHVDLAPTLLEFAGADPIPGLDGESFLPLLVDPAAELEPRTRFIEYLGMVGVRTERWKYISMRGVEPLLYDLSVDPLELHDCIAQYPEIAAKLAAAEAFARAERAKGKAERVVLDAETIEALHALGYL